MLHFKVKRDLPELTENGNFNDFLILESYLDQCVKLRLNGGGGGDYERNLKEAHDISTIITSKTENILNLKFEGKIPVFEVIESRKNIAKFIGLTFFKLGRECLMKFGPNCAINGPCCPLHHLEGLKEAHDLFPKIFEPFGINLNKIDSTSDTFFTSLLAILIDFKTQIIVNDLALKSESLNDFSGLSIHLENLLGDYYGNSMEIPYLKGKLQQRAVQLRGLLELQENENESKVNLSKILKEKYPIDLFESNLKNILRNVYSAIPETFLSELVKKETTINRVNSSNIIDTKPVKAKPISKVEVTSNINADAIANTSDNHLVTNDVINPPMTFKNVLISGKFFRGILEPVDERFAAIIEARDVNVRQYLNQRKRKSLNTEKITIDQARKNLNAVNNNQIITNNKSIMERHDSAERISWETQETETETERESEIKEENIIQPVHRSVPVPVTNRNRNKNMLTIRGRRMFSEQEVLNLIEGIRRFGNDWRRILDNYEFNHRTNVDLKDKARNLMKSGLL